MENSPQSSSRLWRFPFGSWCRRLTSVVLPSSKLPSSSEPTAQAILHILLAIAQTTFLIGFLSAMSSTHLDEYLLAALASGSGEAGVFTRMYSAMAAWKSTLFRMWQPW